MALYSERFIRLSTPLLLAEFTVPAGMRAVVMSVAISNTATQVGRAEVVAGGISVLARSIPARESVLEGPFRAVAYEYEGIAAYLYVEGMSLSIHGYLFDDTPTEGLAGRAAAPEVLDTLPLVEPDEYSKV